MSDQMMDDLTAMDELLTENPTLAKNCTPTPSPHRSQPDSGGPEETVRKGFPSHRGLHCSIKNVPAALEATLSPAFYLTVPIDRPQDNSIYINNGSTNTARNLYSTPGP